MNSDNNPFLKWFGYSRRERRSTFLLFVFLLIVIAYRYIVPVRDTGIEDISVLINSADSQQTFSAESVSDTSRLFSFDPNRTSFDSLTELGLSGKQAATLIKYRNMGGKFRKPDDIKKIYGIDNKTAEELIPYINIEKDSGNARHLMPDTIFYRKARARVDLNRTDSAELEGLPGLGPVLSSRIIKFRKLLGGYVSAEQLKEVYGLTEATYNTIEGSVFADSSDVKVIEINGPGFTPLIKHPYLDRYTIISIIKYKELKGNILNINELINNKIIEESKAKRISPYLRF
jgi:competence protein ComEA